jgi:hypothetical protein
MKKLLYLIPLCCTVFYTSALYPFINVEEIRNSIPSGEQYQLSLSVSGRSGNSSSASYLGEAALYSKKAERELLAIASYKYGKSRKVLSQDQALLHLRQSRTLTDKLAYELFAQYEKNEFTRLSFRALAGTGLRMKLYQVGENYLYTGVGAIYLSEKLESKIGTTDAGTVDIIRGNFYLSGAAAITKNIALSSSSYFQPDVKEFSDYRFHQNLGVKFKVEPAVSLSLFLHLAHDHKPPQLVSTTDSSFGTKLIYKF